MNDKYKLLEDFLLKSLSGFKFSWNLDYDSLPYELDFNNDGNPVPTIYARVSYPNHNELDIQLSETNKGYKSICVNIDKIPRLMSHLSFCDYSFQLAARLELGESEFEEINKYADEIIKTGKFKNKSVTQSTKYPHMFYVDINEQQTMELWFPPINSNNLGFQSISIHIDIPGTPDKIMFKKFIPIHKIKNLPFLNSIVHIQQSDKKELNPDIDEFISYFAKLESEYLSPIAQTIELNMQLNDELHKEEEKDKNKRLKI